MEIGCLDDSCSGKGLRWIGKVRKAAFEYRDSQRLNDPFGEFDDSSQVEETFRAGVTSSFILFN
jgi:hypothetical protein